MPASNDTELRQRIAEALESYIQEADEERRHAEYALIEAQGEFDYWDNRAWEMQSEEFIDNVIETLTDGHSSSFVYAIQTQAQTVIGDWDKIGELQRKLNAVPNEPDEEINDYQIDEAIDSVIDELD